MRELSAGFPILISRGMLGRCGEQVRKFCPCKQAAVIADSAVGPLYLKTVLDSLREAGFQVKTLTFPAGETSKNAETLGNLYDGLLAPYPFAMKPNGVILGLGGGVTMDLAGLAAATLFCGVSYIGIPTTVSAQIHAAISGKAAIHLKQGKNLAGAACQLKAVLIDPDVLDTLPEPVFSGGMAEVIRCGLAGDRELLEQLERCGGREELLPFAEEIISRCCGLRIRFRDEGKEALLDDFGQPLAGAYEKLGGAAAWGMCGMLQLGEGRGLTASGTAERAEKLLACFGIPARDEEITPELLRMALEPVLKSAGAELDMVFCREAGELVRCPVPREEFLKQTEL